VVCAGGGGEGERTPGRDQAVPRDDVDGVGGPGGTPQPLSGSQDVRQDPGGEVELVELVDQVGGRAGQHGGRGAGR